MSSTSSAFSLSASSCGEWVICGTYGLSSGSSAAQPTAIGPRKIRGRIVVSACFLVFMALVDESGEVFVDLDFDAVGCGSGAGDVDPLAGSVRVVTVIGVGVAF